MGDVLYTYSVHISSVLCLLQKCHHMQLSAMTTGIVGISRDHRLTGRLMDEWVGQKWIVIGKPCVWYLM